MTEQLLEFRLPDLGEGLADAELVSWTVAVGDKIELNQTIAEVETAKALVELPSPYAGVVAELLAEAGSTVTVGTVIIRIAADADDPSVSGPRPDVAAEPTGPQRQAVLVGYGPEQATQTRRRRPTPAPTRPETTGPPRPDAKPSARKLARELGIELAEVAGTGLAGAVTADDVYAFQRGNGPADQSDARETRTKVAGVRKRTAEAMELSARTVPTVTEFVTVDVTASMELLENLRGGTTFTDLKLTPLALVAKIVLAALAEHPQINASWDGERNEIVTKHYVNLGIAVATDRGLLVPNVKGAHRMSLRELCREINGVAEAARASTSTPADLRSGTFTITNIGVFGIDAGTPIINPGEAAILCLGAIRKRPWVVEDRIEPRTVTTLGLSFDHRLIDGEQGSRFLASIADMLEDPLTLLSKI